MTLKDIFMCYAISIPMASVAATGITVLTGSERLGLFFGGCVALTLYFTTARRILP